MLMAVCVDVDVAVFISGDADDDVDFIAVAATLFEISVIIAVVIIDGIRNNVDISRITLGEWRENSEEEDKKKPTPHPNWLLVVRNG